MVDSSIQSLVAAARDGDSRATGRLISLVENDLAAGTQALHAVYGRSQSWITGLTGAPGSGKSTLANLLISQWREAGLRVAVLAVDPTSPFTGGALLGDRIRMQRDSLDDGVLIRSMATRGWLGGIARATERVAALCAGLGYERVLLETVGVGQSEVDVAAAADTTLVVLNPGAGDAIQTAKAGIMEIADVFVVNKADRGGANELVRDLTEMLQLAPDTGWRPPIVATIATSTEGIDELVAALDAHQEHVMSVGLDDAAAVRRERDFRRAVVEAVADRTEALLASAAGQQTLTEVRHGSIDPWSAAGRLMTEPGAAS